MSTERDSNDAGANKASKAPAKPPPPNPGRRGHFSSQPVTGAERLTKGKPGLTKGKGEPG